MTKQMHYLPEVYVKRDGSDSTGDGSKEKPFATAQAGADAVVNKGTVYLETSEGLGEIEAYDKEISFKPWVKK